MTSTITETVRNGVDTATLFATLDAIKAQPEIAALPVPGAEQVDRRRTQPQHHQGLSTRPAPRTPPAPQAFELNAGEPAILLGTDTGPNPAEYLLHALAACVTTSLVFAAAARGVRLTSVESTLEGDLDVRGAMGLDDNYRNGFEQIRMTVKIAGDAPAEKLRTIVQRGTDRSVVFDSITQRRPDHRRRHHRLTSEHHVVRQPAHRSQQSPRRSAVGGYAGRPRRRSETIWEQTMSQHLRDQQQHQSLGRDRGRRTLRRRSDRDAAGPSRTRRPRPRRGAGGQRHAVHSCADARWRHPVASMGTARRGHRGRHTRHQPHRLPLRRRRVRLGRDPSRTRSHPPCSHRGAPSWTPSWRTPRCEPARPFDTAPG